MEKAERGKKAQLAYSFDIALQNEFSLEENIALARQFVSEQLVGRGMIADFAIHQPDKEDGNIPNPHFHVLCPIRPIEENGKWGFKQRIKKANNILRDIRKKIIGLTDMLPCFTEDGRGPVSNVGRCSCRASIGANTVTSALSMYAGGRKPPANENAAAVDI